MANNAHGIIDERLEAMERKLTDIYERAEKEIEKTADEYFRKFKKLDDQKRKLVQSGKLSEDEYLTWRKNKILYSKRFTEMKENCARQILSVNETAVAYINGELPGIYTLGYNDLKQAVDGVGGYSFTLVDPDTVKRLATTDKSLLPSKILDPAKDIPWNMKNINAEALQGILQGESMDKIAKRMRNVQEMNKSAAIRTARTIVTGAENKGRQDSYVRAENDGIVMQREWIATFDGRTRHAHALLDGQLADVGKPFKSELGDIMYPGDPDAHPSNVYNCRCTTAAKVYGFDKSKISNENYADRQTVAEWLDEERKKDPEAFDKAQKMLYNKAADKEQYENYVARLGRKELPKGGFKAFQELKYSDSGKYNYLTGYYRYKGNNPLSGKEFYDANLVMKRLKEEGKIRVTGTLVAPTRKLKIKSLRDHAEKRFAERDLSIQWSQNVINNADFAIKQRKGTQLAYYSSEGMAVVNFDGELETTGKLDKGGILLYNEVMKLVKK